MIPKTFRRHVFNSVKGFKGDEKAWPDWRYHSLKKYYMQSVFPHEIISDSSYSRALFRNLKFYNYCANGTSSVRKLPGASGKLLLSWIGQKTHNQPISESDIPRVAARESWADMTRINKQPHGDLVSLMEERFEAFEIVRNIKAEVELDAWEG